jgi:exodeoxyribonuclease V alpha subunit
MNRLAQQQPLHDALCAVVAVEAGQSDRLEALQAAHEQATVHAARAQQRAAASEVLVTAAADRIRDALLTRWDAERNAAAQAARTVLDGSGRLGLRRAAVASAGQQLADWANRWRPHLADLPTDPGRLSQLAGRLDDRPALWRAFDAAARRDAEGSHPECAALRAAAEASRHGQEQARRDMAEGRRSRNDRLRSFGVLAQTPDPVARLADLDRAIAATQHELATAQTRITLLQAESALLGQPRDRIAQEREVWRTRHRPGHDTSGSAILRLTAPVPGIPRPKTERLGSSVVRGGAAPGLGR